MHWEQPDNREEQEWPEKRPRAEQREARDEQEMQETPETDDLRLPMICLLLVPHPAIPGLYQRCFEYVEPWQWSPITELVETGWWFFPPRAPETGNRNGE